MTEGNIFISYRRADASGFAGRLFDRLSSRFGEENVFMDVEGLDLGVDFHKALDRSVGACDVLIVLIGKQWLDIKDENRKRRLDDPEDFVRIEIAAALNRDIRIIPILVQDARMPESEELPEELQRLTRYNGMEIRHERFNADTDRLIRGIENCFKEEKERREREAIEQAAEVKAEQERREREAIEQAAEVKAEQEHNSRELATAYSAAVGGRVENTNNQKNGIPPQTQENQIATVIEISEKHPAKIFKKWLVPGLLVFILLLSCVASAIWGMNNFINLRIKLTQITRISPTIEVLPAKDDISPRTPTPPPPSLSPTNTLFVTQTRTASLISPPSETPSPIASFDSISIVAQESIIVRSGPGVMYRWVEGSPYPAETEFLIEGRSEDFEWYFVILTDGLEGWVQVSDFQTDIDSNTLPIIEAPPTPLPPPTITPKPNQKKDKDSPTDKTPYPYP